MGKSPGKWIKTVLFGKKSSKSNLSKDSKTENKSSITAKASSGDYGADTMVISSPVPQVVTCEENTGIDNGSTTDLAYNAVADGSSTLDLNATNEVERSRLEEAATKAQAAFRGYLARRAFWALKGIIRLQALVRGHLVRRQAVASLRCMRAIIEFQALIRGRKVRLSGAVRPMTKMYTPGELAALKRVDLLGKSLKLEKLSTNAFGIKLLASLPTAMHLSFQYDPVDPNSVWNWLERWSASHFWEPLPRPKKVLDAKPKRRQAKLQNEETESGRPKRSVRRIPAMNGDNNLSHSSETEKPKRSVRKVPSHQPESVQEQSHNELEKVKRNLRKISVSTAVASERSEVATEKPPTSSEKASVSEKASAPTSSEKASGPTTSSEKASGPPTASEKASGPPTTSEKMSGLPTTLEKVSGDGSGSPIDGTPEPWMDQTSEKVDELNLVVPKKPELETPPVPPPEDEPLVVLHDDHPVLEPVSLETNGKADHDSTANEELTKKEDQTIKENQRTRRRKSFPAKQEHSDSISQNTATLPSYMAATESAKAKLRAQAAAKTLEDGPENGFTRRHSLPSSTNSKLSLQSPRVQRPIQANGKAGSKSNKSQISPRDEKALQVGWKR